MNKLNILSKIKPWYRCWWGILILVIIALFLAFVLAIVFQTISLVRQVQKGEIAIAELTPQGREAQAKIAQTRNIIESFDDPSRGPANASVVIVEFGDFNCPVSYQSAPIMKQLSNIYPSQIKVIFRDFPNVSQESLRAAVAAECVHEQGDVFFWLMHDKLFANQDNFSDESLYNLTRDLGIDMDQFYDCFTQNKTQPEVKEDYTTALEQGVTGTPTFFINGNLVTGLQTLESWRTAIDYLLKK